MTDTFTELLYKYESLLKELILLSYNDRQILINHIHDSTTDIQNLDYHILL